MRHDSAIVRALVGQVARAAHGHVETDVVTFITKPMWQAFCRGVGVPTNSKPTEWIGPNKTIRVYGSKTIIIPGKGFISVSLCGHETMKPSQKRETKRK